MLQGKKDQNMSAIKGYAITRLVDLALKIFICFFEELLQVDRVIIIRYFTDEKQSNFQIAIFYTVIY